MSRFQPPPPGYDAAVDESRRLRRLVDDVLSTSAIVPGLRAAEELQWAACRTTGSADVVRTLLDLMEQRGDELAAIAGIHALSAVPGPAATSGLTDALDDGRWFVTEHAAWALSARPPHPPAMGRLAAIVADGGFRAMLAQRTLAGWAGGDAAGVLDALLGALRAADGPARARLVDTAGTVPGVAATALLESAASDDVTAVRLAAIGALGWRRGDPALLGRLAMIDDPVGQAALLALIDRTPRRSSRHLPQRRPHGETHRPGRLPRRSRRAVAIGQASATTADSPRSCASCRTPSPHATTSPRSRRSPAAAPPTRSPTSPAGSTGANAWRPSRSAATPTSTGAPAGRTASPSNGASAACSSPALDPTSSTSGWPTSARSPPSGSPATSASPSSSPQRPIPTSCSNNSRPRPS